MCYNKHMDNENTAKNEPVVAPVASDSEVGDPVVPADNRMNYKRTIVLQSADQLHDFYKYCAGHPNERFWQALRNWSDSDFIFAGHMSNTKGGKDFATVDGVKIYIEDTFNK